MIASPYLSFDSFCSVVKQKLFCYFFIKKVRVIVLSLSLCVTTISKLQAQCPAGSIFRTQELIDSFKTYFPGCTQVPGLIEISGDITNLDGLSHITSFDGGLHIYSPMLQSIDGLNNVTSISNLVINAPGLQQITGFNALTKITGDLTIASTNLQSVGGFSALDSIGGKLVIEGSNALINFNGLSSLKTIGSWLTVSGNSALQNFDGLDSLTSIGAISGLSVFISDNGQLQNINGLNAVTKIDGTIYSE